MVYLFLCMFLISYISLRKLKIKKKSNLEINKLKHKKFNNLFLERVKASVLFKIVLILNFFSNKLN
jgi:hypothetical protein